MYLAYRFRPFFRPALARSRPAWTATATPSRPIRTWLLVGVSAACSALFAGTSASGGVAHLPALAQRRAASAARTPTSARTSASTSSTCPGCTTSSTSRWPSLVVALLAAAVVHYLYGGIRLQTPGDRLSGAAQVQLSVLLGLFVLAKAADYWLDRYDLVNAVRHADHRHHLHRRQRGAAGQEHPARHRGDLRGALLPQRLAAHLAAAVGGSRAARRSRRSCSALIWPGIVQQFQVKPVRGRTRRRRTSRRTSTATRAAYDLDDVEVERRTPATATAPTSRARRAIAETPSVPLVDPQLVRQTFEQNQQVRVLLLRRRRARRRPLQDRRHRPRARARRPRARPERLCPTTTATGPTCTPSTPTATASSRRTPTSGPPTTAPSGTDDPVGRGPAAADQDALTERDRAATRPGSTSASTSPDYSIVGKAPRTRGRRARPPAGERRRRTRDQTTYDGEGGVAVGCTFRQLLYAVEVRRRRTSCCPSGSTRTARCSTTATRASGSQKVAPWLTVDDDAYPAVVDGGSSGSSTATRRPTATRCAEQESFETMTDDSLARTTPACATLPTDEINYMRNAVKATVDAYDGTVHALRVGRRRTRSSRRGATAFPGTVHDRRPRSPRTLHRAPALPRGPVQGAALPVRALPRDRPRRRSTRSNDRWVVPKDPSAPTKLQPPYRLFVEDPDTGVDNFALTSVYVPYEQEQPGGVRLGGLRRDLADVRADPGAPAAQREHAGPGQHRQRDAVGPRRRRGPAAAAAGRRVARDLRQPADAAGRRRADVRRSRSTPSAPALRRQLPDPALRAGLLRRQGRHRQHPRRARSSTSSAATRRRRPRTAATDNPPTDDSGNVPTRVRNLLDQAEESFQAADEAFAAGKVGQWATLVEEGRAKVDEAIRILTETNAADRRADRRADRWGHSERRGDARRVTDPRFGWPCAVE